MISYQADDGSGDLVHLGYWQLPDGLLESCFGKPGSGGLPLNDAGRTRGPCHMILLTT